MGGGAEVLTIWGCQWAIDILHESYALVEVYSLFKLQSKHNQMTSPNSPLLLPYSSACKQIPWNDTKRMWTIICFLKAHFKLLLLFFYLFIDWDGKAGLTTYLGISQSWATREGPIEKKQPPRPEEPTGEHSTHRYFLPISSQISSKYSKFDVNVKLKTKTRASGFVCLYMWLGSFWFLNEVKTRLRQVHPHQFFIKRRGIWPQEKGDMAIAWSWQLHYVLPVNETEPLTSRLPVHLNMRKSNPAFIIHL